MKILLVSDEYSPCWGPCTVRLRVFSDVFRQLGHEVTVLASSTNLAHGAGDDNAIYCSAPKLDKSSALSRLKNNLGFALSAYRAGVRLDKPDVVIATSPPVFAGLAGWRIARARGAKFVYDVRDIWPDVAVEMGSFSRGSIYYKVFKTITDRLLRGADLVTTVSPGKVKSLRAKLPAEHRDKVILAENGLDENFVLPEPDASVAEKYGLRERFTCVYIGNIGLAQGLEHFIRLAETADPEKYSFLLFGDGAERSRLEKMAQDKGLTHVRFCGLIDSKTVYSVLSYASMAYIPLVNAGLKDSIPTKTYEAMGAGCPILMVAEGDAPALLAETGFGLSLSPSDTERLPEVFREFCGRYSEFTARRDDARSAALLHHSRQQIARELESRLRALTGGSR